MTREESINLAKYEETPYYFQSLINKIYDEFNLELEALENKFKVEQENNLSSEIAKTETILGLKKYIEALENRSCESCKYSFDIFTGIDDSLLGEDFICTKLEVDKVFNKDFYCSEWESRC